MIVLLSIISIDLIGA